MSAPQDERAPGDVGHDAIRFVLDDRIVEAAGLPPTTTVLEFLREHLGRTGTKEGCAEGDCGACTVVLGETRGGSMRYRAINSCIRFLPTIDGKELVTVESLAGNTDTLHPVQQAMVDRHASQCGFCTPGFVMSLFAAYLNQTAVPTREQVLETLAGNLCRCTGYRPIIDAALTMHGYPEPVRWSRSDAQAPEHAARLHEIHRERALALPGFIAPRTIEELAAALEAAPQSLLLAGGTDVGLWVTKHLRELPPIVYVGEVEALGHIENDGQRLRIGAAVALTDAWQAIVARIPALAEVAERFASPPVRNSGTLCGNVANGSPIGDAMPVLIALGASVERRRGTRMRSLALEDFYLGYQKKALEAGEFVLAVHIQLPEPGTRVASYKLSKRIDQDISAVCAAFALRIDDGRVAEARIAYGGMAAIPARARHAEAALFGKAFDENALAAAIDALASDFKPISDMRASADYRLKTAGTLLRRFFLERTSGAAPLRTQDVVVVS